MLHFTKLRLSGFKSFADPAELMILPGLTGIVGPNGCGKSNLVEGLRWVMGESSARMMRGGEMDDVIFGGTAKRPARAHAEVSLHLDNRLRKAPPPFDNEDDLEISRRIDRGEGSLYRVNGKDTRARDIQLLFADGATGARSIALVGQGKIGAIINSRPSERRSILEEAAGIAGLHSRRHEAELKLKGAEGNLERLQDVIATLEEQLQGLKKQARQAVRYRNLSANIRSTEARILLSLWNKALAGFATAREELEALTLAVEEATQAAASAATEEAEAAALLPQLRQKEAEAAARLQRLLIARDQLDAEEGRLNSAKEELEARLKQVSKDLEREQELLESATESYENLQTEAQEIMAGERGLKEKQQGLQTQAQKHEAKVLRLEEELAKLTRDSANLEAERNALNKRIIELSQRELREKEKIRELTQKQVRLKEEAAQLESEKEELGFALEEYILAEEDGREKLAQAEEGLIAAQKAAHQAQSQLQEQEAKTKAWEVEAQSLEKALARKEGEFSSIANAIRVDPGFELALAAALGDDLQAPLEEPEALRSWFNFPTEADSQLPAGVAPLAQHVKAPQALTARLSQIGVCEDGAGIALKAGQRLVSKEGALWRWDGFTAKPGGIQSLASTRFLQQNRLSELEAELAALANLKAELVVQAQACKTAEVQADTTLKSTKEALKENERRVGLAKDSLAQSERKAQALKSQTETLGNNQVELQQNLEEIAESILEARERLEELPQDIETREQMAIFREELAIERGHLLEVKTESGRLEQEKKERELKLVSLARDANAWQARIESASRQCRELIKRQTQAQEELNSLSNRPEKIAQERNLLLEQINQAEIARKEAISLLTQGETQAHNASRALKTIEHALFEVREDKIRKEGTLREAKIECQNVAARIQERIECSPEQLNEVVDIEDEKQPLEALERKLERLLHERQNMGPVNLRAESESEEMEDRINAMKSERDDLVGAIGKLMKAIDEINREGKERLMTSFKAVDQHFRELFIRLFGGGRAHLALTATDDPMTAGLEIMASPPGKRLQTLSLLSGGEQALTAIALIFAVFMTNPAPICVLDEVDAPLDDANVDRFCSLVTDIAHSAQTRFLVVTHHRMSMARMDRLYGVTMAERGISQLVSVDLKQL